MITRFHVKIDTIQSDNEMRRKKTTCWLCIKDIEFESSALWMQDQNETAECSGDVIMKKTWVMWISANLLHDLWMKIVNSAVYLHNQTPQTAQNWKTLYKVFYFNVEEKFLDYQKKSQLVHLKTYSCRAYAMTENAQLKQNKKWKLNSQTYIDYFVDYVFMNIFRVWISHKDEVISTWDVIFDESIFFNGKSESLSSQLIAEMNSLITWIQLSEMQITNECLLKKDEKILESSFEDESDDEPEPEIMNLNEKKNFELVRALEKTLQLSILSSSENRDSDSLFAFHV